MRKRARARSVEGNRGQALRYAADEGVIIGDSEGRITHLNPAAERILGLGAGDVIGRTCSDVLAPLAREGKEELARAVEQLLSCPLPGAAKVIRAGAAVGARAFELWLSPLVGADGGVAGIVGVLRDLAKDAEIDRARSEFITTVSHELRGPATSIKGYVDLLGGEGNGALGTDQRELIRVLKRNSDRMADLIGDLLDVSLIDSGQVRFEPESVEIGAIVDDVLVAAGGEAESKQQELTWRVEGDVPRVIGDKGRLHQVLANLVDNAIRYTPEGGRIEVLVHAVEGAARVDVKDNGIGIPAAELGRVFERFYRGEHGLVRATPGTGLGLSIVEMLVEMHGGRVWVESVPGKGSTFTVILPAASGVEGD
jgi:two-component system phosphate regulon sensor histidine kinase PhoR